MLVLFLFFYGNNLILEVVILFNDVLMELIDVLDDDMFSLLFVLLLLCFRLFMWFVFFDVLVFLLYGNEKVLYIISLFL